MTRFTSRGARIALTLALVLLAAGPAAAAQQVDEGLFGAPRAQVTEPPARFVVQSRLVDVASAVLAESTEPGATLKLDLFRGERYTAVLDRIERRGPGRYSWIGRLREQPGGLVVLAVVDDVVVGSITTPTAAYQLRYVADGVHVLRQVDPSAYPDELQAPVIAPPRTREWIPPPNVDPETGVFTPTEGETTVNLMVVYTPRTRQAAGGTTAMEALVDLGVTETNMAFGNSDVDVSLLLVHVEEVFYIESNSLSVDVNNLQGTFDPWMNEVHETRAEVGADLVELIVENASSGCGLAAGIMCGVTPSFGCQAFCATVRDCISPNYTFGHELGHLMGCNHAIQDPTGCGAFEYSYGYKDPFGAFRTIMAYNCSGGCTRRLQWSNPLVNLEGRPTGSAGADNARSLNNSAATIASFRDETTPCSVVCVTTTALQDDPDVDKLLEHLYDFRDEVLLPSPEGQLYVNLFYKNAAEARVLVEKHESLRRATEDALKRAIPVLRKRVAGEPAWLGVGDLTIMDQVLAEFARLGSDGLRQDVSTVRGMLGTVDLYRRFGLMLKRSQEAEEEKTPVSDNDHEGVARDASRRE